MSNEALEAYIEAVARIGEERPDRVSGEDLREIALELGVDEGTLALAAKRAQDHAKRARTLHRQNLFGDAVDEYERALALEPSREDWRVLLAYAVHDLGVQNNQASDVVRAEKLARRVLNVDPENEAAAKLVAQATQWIANQRGALARRRGSMVARVVRWTASLAVLAGLGVLAYYYWMWLLIGCGVLVIFALLLS